MNHAKLDPALAAALEDVTDTEGRQLIVFVDIENDAVARATGSLEHFGLGAGGGRGGVRTATLSARAVDELSEQPWVERLRLAQRLDLAHEEDDSP